MSHKLDFLRILELYALVIKTSKSSEDHSTPNYVDCTYEKIEKYSFKKLSSL